MKKNLAILAAAACMAAALTACGSTNTATSGTADAGTAPESNVKTTGDSGSAGTASAANDGSGGGSEASGKETKASGGKLIMATNAEFPPYEFYDNNQIVGIDADIARAIATKLGMELEITDMAFDSLIPALQSGKADFVAAGMTVDPDRLKNVDFTDTYATAAQVIIVTEDSPVKALDDLEGKKIGVQTGTTGDIYTDKIKDAKVQRFNKGMEAVMALSQEKIDAVIIDKEPAKVFAEQKQGLKILSDAFEEEQYAIAIKKGNTELLNKMNGALKELKDSGELQKIVDRYITVN